MGTSVACACVSWCLWESVPAKWACIQVNKTSQDMWYDIMSPLLEPPAARPHATDPAPCLNRCSINNACSSATHLPGGQIGKRRVDESETEWEGMRQCLKGGQEGRRMGKSPGVRVTTGRWVGFARRSQRTSEPADEVSSSSHLLQRGLAEIRMCAIWV